jgi:hypothetical protein
MNNANTQQHSFLGSIKPIIFTSLASRLFAGDFNRSRLINKNQYGIQHKQLNQRQKRKQARQSNRINN